MCLCACLCVCTRARALMHKSFVLLNLQYILEHNFVTNETLTFTILQI